MFQTLQIKLWKLVLSPYVLPHDYWIVWNYALNYSSKAFFYNLFTKQFYGNNIFVSFQHIFWHPQWNYKVKFSQNENSLSFKGIPGPFENVIIVQLNASGKLLNLFIFKKKYMCVCVEFLCENQTVCRYDNYLIRLHVFRMIAFVVYYRLTQYWREVHQGKGTPQ